MSPYQVIVGAGVAAVLAGICGAIYLWRAAPADPFRTRATRVRRAGRREAARQRTIRFTAAAVGGLGAWLLSGWPVAGLIVAAAIIVMPVLLDGPRVQRRRIERLEALEEWVRRLAASMAAGSPPIQTLVDSADHAPTPLQAELNRLATRLRTPRLDRTTSLRRFADELDDPLGDIVALALDTAISTHASERAPYVLDGLATSVASEVRARRAIEKERTGPRKEMMLLLALIGALVAGFILLTDWTAPYGTPSGQLVLALLGGSALLALWMMRRLTIGRTPPRILSTVTDESTER